MCIFILHSTTSVSLYQSNVSRYLPANVAAPASSSHQCVKMQFAHLPVSYQHVDQTDSRLWHTGNKLIALREQNSPRCLPLRELQMRTMILQHHEGDKERQVKKPRRCRTSGRPLDRQQICLSMALDGQMLHNYIGWLYLSVLLYQRWLWMGAALERNMVFGVMGGI